MDSAESGPKHSAVRRRIRALALELKPGDALPGERLLEEKFGVSRITIRRAISDLCAEGLLVRLHGKGTFVSHGQIRSNLHLASFNEDMRSSGIEPTTTVLRADRCRPPARIARFLGLIDLEEAHRLTRLRLGNGTPVSIDDSWLPARLTTGMLDGDLTGSLYSALSAQGTPVLRAQQTVGAQSASAEEAAHLQIPGGSPVLVFERESFTVIDGVQTPIEFSTSTYRSDRYRVSMTLESPS